MDSFFELQSVGMDLFSDLAESLLKDEGGESGETNGIMKGGGEGGISFCGSCGGVVVNLRCKQCEMMWNKEENTVVGRPFVSIRVGVGQRSAHSSLECYAAGGDDLIAGLASALESVSSSSPAPELAEVYTEEQLQRREKRAQRRKFLIEKGLAIGIVPRPQPSLEARMDIFHKRMALRMLQRVDKRLGEAPSTRSLLNLNEESAEDPLSSVMDESSEAPQSPTRPSGFNMPRPPPEKQHHQQQAPPKNVDSVLAVLARRTTTNDSCASSEVDATSPLATSPPSDVEVALSELRRPGSASASWGASPIGPSPVGSGSATPTENSEMPGEGKAQEGKAYSRSSSSSSPSMGAIMRTLSRISKGAEKQLRKRKEAKKRSVFPPVLKVASARVITENLQDFYMGKGSPTLPQDFPGSTPTATMLAADIQSCVAVVNHILLDPNLEQQMQQERLLKSLVEILKVHQCFRQFAALLCLCDYQEKDIFVWRSRTPLTAIFSVCCKELAALDYLDTIVGPFIHSFGTGDRSAFTTMFDQFVSTLEYTLARVPKSMQFILAEVDRICGDPRALGLFLFVRFLLPFVTHPAHQDYAPDSSKHRLVQAMTRALGALSSDTTPESGFSETERAAINLQQALMNRDFFYAGLLRSAALSDEQDLRADIGLTVYTILERELFDYLASELKLGTLHLNNASLTQMLNDRYGQRRNELSSIDSGLSQSTDDSEL